MRILLVSEVSSFMPGGVPAETRALAQGLLARGVAVGLVADAPIQVDGVTHFALEIGAVSDYRSRLSGAIDTFKPDVTHVIAMGSHGLYRLLPALRARPWLLTAHSISPSEKKFQGLHASEWAHYGARALRYLPHTLSWHALFRLGQIDCTIVHSEQVYSAAKGCGAPDSALELIALGADVSGAPMAAHRTVKPGAPRILTVAGMAHTKGLHDALDAVAALRRDFPGLRYDMVGEVRDASYLRFLQARIGSLKLAGHVHLHHGASEALKGELTQQADLYIQPSHEEGFCLAFIEGAHGVPRLVGTATGAIAAICADDSFSACVPARQAGLLAEAMGRLLRQQPSQEQLAARHQRLLTQFSWARYLDEHERVYQRLVA